MGPTGPDEDSYHLIAGAELDEIEARHALHAWEDAQLPRTPPLASYQALKAACTAAFASVFPDNARARSALEGVLLDALPLHMQDDGDGGWADPDPGTDAAQLRPSDVHRIAYMVSEGAVPAIFPRLAERTHENMARAIRAAIRSSLTSPHPQQPVSDNEPPKKSSRACQHCGKPIPAARGPLAVYCSGAAREGSPENQAGSEASGVG